MLKKETQKKWFFTIRSKMSLSLVVVSLVTLAFSAVISYQLASDRVMDISMRLSAQSMGSQGEVVQDYIMGLQNASMSLHHQDSLHAIAHMQTPTSGACMEYEREFGSVAQRLTNVSAAKYAFSFVGIYLENGYTFETSSMIQLPYDGYHEAVEYYAQKNGLPIGEQYVSGRWFSGEKGLNGEDTLTYVRFLYDRASLKKLGIVVYGFHAEQLDKIADSGVSDCFLLAPDGTLVTAVGPYLPGTRYPEADRILAAMEGEAEPRQSASYVDSEGEKRIVFFCYIWQIDAYLVAPFDYYEDVRAREMESFVQSLLLFAGAMIVVMVLVGILISRGLTKSVTDLVEFTQKITGGRSELRHTPSTNDEIAVLGCRINDMLDQLQLANDQRETEMRANQTMAIQLLQQQINPHLLYNTLDSLLWALQQKRFEDAIPLVTALSEFFRISLSRGKEMISLRDEMRVCEYFIDLQRLARQKNFRLITQIPEEFLDMKINKLTLQPLVENAVIHGLAGYRDDGVIRISAEKQDENIVITVEDNGIGMTQEEVETVNWALQQFPRPESFNHFGLYNIHRRIVRAHSAQFGLTVQSEISEYTKITIRIPMEETPEE